MTSYYDWAHLAKRGSATGRARPYHQPNHTAPNLGPLATIRDQQGVSIPQEEAICNLLTTRWGLIVMILRATRKPVSLQQQQQYYNNNNDNYNYFHYYIRINCKSQMRKLDTKNTMTPAGKVAQLKKKYIYIYTYIHTYTHVRARIPLLTMYLANDNLELQRQSNFLLTTILRSYDVNQLAAK